MTTFQVFGHASTKGSTVSFMGKNGRIVTKSDCKQLAAWTQAVGWAARAARLPLAPAGTPVCVSVLFQFVKPVSASKRGAPVVKPDLDKLLRALLDALTSVAYVDDAQVVEIYARKVYGPDASTSVTIRQEA